MDTYNYLSILTKSYAQIESIDETIVFEFPRDHIGKDSSMKMNKSKSISKYQSSKSTVNCSEYFKLMR